MKTRIGTLALNLFLASFLTVSCGGEASVQQPIKYNHKKHIEQGLGCLDCHVNAEEGERATIPTLVTCMECHEQALTESTEEVTLRTLAKSGIRYPWKQITFLREDVLFSHRRHCVLAAIECSECHGKMKELEKPPQRVAIKMTMNFCMKCHQSKDADTDCIACHR